MWNTDDNVNKVNIDNYNWVLFINELRREKRSFIMLENFLMKEVNSVSIFEEY